MRQGYRQVTRYRGKRTLSILIAVVGLFGIGLSPVHAVNRDEYQLVQSLVFSGEFTQALQQVDRLLQIYPTDFNARLLRGVILAKLQRYTEAIDVFTQLNEELPGSPEPLNNLAVVYAAQGDYEQAQYILHRALNTHPSYALSYNNLTVLYAQQASSAYRHALDGKSPSQESPPELALIDTFSTIHPTTPKDSSESTARALSTNKLSPTKPPKQEGGEKATTGDSATSRLAKKGGVKGGEQKISEDERTKEIAAVPLELATSVVDQGSRATTKTVTKKETTQAQNPPQQQVIQWVKSWSSAWSSRNFEKYLGFYDDSFQPSEGISYTQWKSQRRNRIYQPKSISVAVKDIKIKYQGDDTIEVRFTQKYKSDRYTDETAKVLVLKKGKQNWQIVREYGKLIQKSDFLQGKKASP